ncbi:MAG: tRNA 2-thiouridine(34) synthase MnmA [Lachnospiraceae bacterium]|nr:tRNA 2-thiouridine(34) synthase MnmA [Lachnospiraceae bacterium]
MINKKRVVVGMSGGVDSSVAAYLLKEAGYDVVGVTMEIWPRDTEEETSAKGGCCGMRAAEDAARVAQKIGIPHYVMNFREEFREKVIHYFMEEYLAGRTPNPCIACNRYVKWESLLHRSLQIGADYIATGHYARIEQLPNGRYAIRRSVTAAKDQTYALYNLTQEQLAHTLMPVGAYDKPAIRAIAEEIGLTVTHKPDSQEICFVPDQDYAGFIEKNSTRPVPPPGNFVTARGEILGRHRGITHYTIGQRKGLNLSLGHPVFVTEIRPETNEVVIGEAQDVFTDHLYCDHLNYMSVPAFADGMRVTAKIRYNHAGAPATVRRIGDDCAEVRFDEPVRAVTPGQAVVFYDGDSIAGGGTICTDSALLPKIRHISDENLQDIV